MPVESGEYHPDAPAHAAIDPFEEDRDLALYAKTTGPLTFELTATPGGGATATGLLVGDVLRFERGAALGDRYRTIESINAGPTITLNQSLKAVTIGDPVIMSNSFRRGGR